MKKFWIRAMLEQLIPALITGIVFTILYLTVDFLSGVFIGLAIISFIFAIFTLAFYRCPNRNIPEGENIIVAPADGKIVAIKREKDKYLFEGKEILRVSIFLNAFNVHINRIPYSGEVIFEKYNKGKYLAAFSEKASLDNEQMMMGIETDHGKILVKQIAGLIARRVICIPKTKDKVIRGDIYGMIKFGSRTDILLESEVELDINIGDKVKGGETILGRFI
jgi:phosphatidylserine decarboxylase